MRIHTGEDNWGQGLSNLSQRGQDVGKRSQYRQCLLLPHSHPGLEGELESSRKTGDLAKEAGWSRGALAGSVSSQPSSLTTHRAASQEDLSMTLHGTQPKENASLGHL